jgi:hypothetical protein
VKISKRKADRIINWEAIMKSKKEATRSPGKVTKKIKGGLLVDIGVPVFLPAPGRHPPPRRDLRLDRPPHRRDDPQDRRGAPQHRHLAAAR